MKEQERGIMSLGDLGESTGVSDKSLPPHRRPRQNQGKLINQKKKVGPRKGGE